MARYTIRANNSEGVIDFPERLTLGAALARAQELRDAQFEHITLINQFTGVEITDLDAFMPGSTRTPVMVELTDASNGRRFSLHPVNISLISDTGTGSTSRVVMTDGKEYSVKGSSVEVLRRINEMTDRV